MNSCEHENWFILHLPEPEYWCEDCGRRIR